LRDRWFGCSGCVGCSGCSGCFGCTGCSGCYGCSGCHGVRLGYWAGRNVLFGCYGGCRGCSGCCGCFGLTSNGCIGHTYGMPMGDGWITGEVWGATYSYSASRPFVPARPASDKPSKAAAGIPEGAAQLVIDVPAAAKLYVDGNLMRSTAEQRFFYTPPLKSGQTYFYDVRVELQKGDKVVTDTRRVYVRTGEVARESFSALEARTSIASK
jgi:uncharacterized protein (TIGR03000 family)